LLLLSNVNLFNLIFVLSQISLKLLQYICQEITLLHVHSTTKMAMEINIAPFGTNRESNNLHVNAIWGLASTATVWDIPLVTHGGGVWSL
jgi:hypothetical protein